MRIRLLGDVAIESGTNRFVPARSGERCVLATLALEPARLVRIGTLIGNIWDDGEPPAKAEETVATYVRSVRRWIGRAGGERGWVRNLRPGAYELRIDAARIDYHLFRGLRAAAEASTRSGDRVRALDVYSRALELWRGQPLANVDGGWAERRRYVLRQEWLDTTCASMDLRLRMGQYREVAVCAQQLVHEHPTERVATLALQGLAYSGDQAMVREFFTLAAKRMWHVAGARPTAELLALARRLSAAAARPPLPVPRPSAAPGAGGVIMSATHNQQVWQALGDQYITHS